MIFFYTIILITESTTDLERKTLFALSHYFIFIFHWLLKPKPFIYSAPVKLYKECTTDWVFCFLNNNKYIAHTYISPITKFL